MFGVLQLDGPLARFTLRSWTASVGVESLQAERVRCHDAYEALTLLRGIVDGHSLRRLASFMAEIAGQPHINDPLDLLWSVARRITSGELVLMRERIEPMPSEPVEVVETPAFVPVANEIDEGIEHHVEPLVRASPAIDQRTLDCQARQAETLRRASVMGVPFCEICACA
jgi:hypothetical protein